MENLHLRQNPRVDEGFSLKRETCRSSDIKAVAATKWLGSRSSEKPVAQARNLSLKRESCRSSEKPVAQARNLSLKRHSGSSYDKRSWALAQARPLSLKRDPSRSSEIQGQFWGLFSSKIFGALEHQSTPFSLDSPLAERTENHQALATGTSYNPHTSEHSEWQTKSEGLCNGTRLVVTRMANHVLQTKIMSGKNIGNVTYIPRLSMSPSQCPWLFTLIRRQFPIIVSYAMTINKSEGQSLESVRLYLRDQYSVMINYM
ncbi:hypothetical protein Lal_00018639 [Lupinus albus]|nr:hypothetical protein Lal_00018639 [Lupinus albus]